MSVNAFAVRQRAAEGHWFNTEDRLAIVRRLERMVESVRCMNFVDFFPVAIYPLFTPRKKFCQRLLNRRHHSKKIF